MPGTIDTTPHLDRGLVTARERLACFQFKAGGAFYYLRSYLFGGAGDTDNVKINEHRYDGRNFVAATVMTGIDENLAGTFNPYYQELPVIMRSIFGNPISSGLVDTTYAANAAGTLRKEVFDWPVNGSPFINLWNVQFGSILYGRGKHLTWNADVMRLGDGGALTGNATLHFNDILGAGFATPGSVAQNAKFTVVASNASGALGLSYRLPGAATSQNVSMAIGDTAVQTKAKFEANGDGVTVNVVGTIATGAGEVHSLNGTGNTVSFYSGAVTLNTATSTLASIQAAIRALAGRTTAVVTGTITAAVAGGPTFVVAGAGNAAYNATYTQSGTYNGYPQYVSPSGKILYYSAGYWALGTNAYESGSGFIYYSQTTSTTVPSTGWTTNNGTAPAPSVTAGATTTGTPGSASLTITYNASDGNVGDIETVPGAGYTGTSTPPGGAAGTVTIEFVAPAQAAVTLSKTSGVMGYTVAETQPGSDGSGPRSIPSAFDYVPVEADNSLIEMFDSWAQLDAANMADDNRTSILLDVYGHTLSSGDAWKPVWTENRSQAPSNFVGNAPTVAFSLTVNQGATSEALRILQNGCVMNKKFFRISFKCGQWEWWIDLKTTRNDAQKKGNEEDLPTRTTDFIAADDNVKVFRVHVIGPATDYFIP